MTEPVFEQVAGAELVPVELVIWQAKTELPLSKTLTFQLPVKLVLVDAKRFVTIAPPADTGPIVWMLSVGNPLVLGQAAWSLKSMYAVPMHSFAPAGAVVRKNAVAPAAPAAPGSAGRSRSPRQGRSARYWHALSCPDASAAHRQQCDVPRLAPTVSGSRHYCELCRAGRGIPLAPGWANFPEPLITGVQSWPAPSSEGAGTPHAP